jgi:hypothetical protein
MFTAMLTGFSLGIAFMLVLALTKSELPEEQEVVEELDWKDQIEQLLIQKHIERVERTLILIARDCRVEGETPERLQELQLARKAYQHAKKVALRMNTSNTF